MSTKFKDLDEDSLAHCINYLTIKDLSNLSLTCKFLNRLAYSDSIWHRFYRERWPLEQELASRRCSSVREAYLARHVALNQFKYLDPLTADFYTNDNKSCDHVLLDDDNNYFYSSQGSDVQQVKIDEFLYGKESAAYTGLTDHNARITCMRLFPICETSLYRSELQRRENILVTSSCDHSIRLWWKGSCQRCFRGHNGPVSTLSDELLGESGSKVLASGGEDGTVRLWSLSSSGKRGQHALKATFYGHERPIKLMAVARHKTSLLVSMSKDSKVRVWDTATSSTSRSSCCVGTSVFPGTPVGMKCDGSLLYAGSGSSVVIVDLRTMQKVITAAICRPKLYSFGIAPSKSLICTGGDGKAMLWDTRKNQETQKLKPIIELDGHTGPVTQLHMDPYKIVTGGTDDLHINVWETGNGMQTNSLICCPEDATMGSGCSAMAVKGMRIVTAACSEEHGIVCFRDFSNASYPIVKDEDEHTSKFWGSQSYSDDDS